MATARNLLRHKRPSEPRSVKERFELINRARLQRMNECLTERQQEFVAVLPLLFHVNHPLLPGYVGQGTPCGIANYTPEPSTLRAALRISRSFAFSRRAMHRLEILGLYLMGSIGTIAHSEHSDLDVWLCHNPEMEPSRIEELNQKAIAIEAWAAELNLEVHFFTVNPESFRQGQLQRLSGESSGSTQHALLLDEFYRSGLVLAGLYPLWWQVPPEQEGRYDAYVAELLEKRFVRDGDFIDFGGLAQIPAEEFFGATLWQLSKSINSPYKSVLKLMLMETYASEYPSIDLLSVRYKAQVYSGVRELDELDPYVLMYRKIEDYLRERGDEGRLALLRRCFYLKVDEPLSVRRGGRAPSWRTEVLQALTTAWGWSEKEPLQLDSRANWKLHTVLEERRGLVSVLTHSYRQLSNFARKHAENPRITQADLNVLGRRLYAAFERKAGKLELVNRGIAPNLLEDRVSLHHLPAQDAWVLFSGTVLPEEIGDHTPLRRAASVLEILAWCHLNQLLDGNTLINLYKQSGNLSVKEIRATIAALDQIIPGGRIPESSVHDLGQSPRLTTVALFINVGIDPLALRAPNGGHRASSRNNALSYGGLHENLALSFDMVLATSWEEVFAHRHQDVGGLMDCVCEYLRWAPVSKQMPPPGVSAVCLTPGYGTAIGRRIQALFADVVQSFYGLHASPKTRYIVEAEDTYHVITLEGDAPTHQSLGTYTDLVRYLGTPTPEFCPVVVDRNSLRESPLPVIYRANRADVVQMFFQIQGRNVNVFVLDEKGALFAHTTPFYDGNALVSHYALFFESVRRRQSELISGAPHSGAAAEFHVLNRGPDGQYRVEAFREEPQPGLAGYFNIQVIGTVDDDNNTVFTIYCDDREFSSLEHGSDLFAAVAREVVKQRRSGLAYPIYITDIDLSHGLLGAERSANLQTIHFLNYKRNIEDRLNRSLNAL